MQHRRLPAPLHDNHDPWHPCAHPVLHRIALRVVLGGWLYWAVVYGGRWGVMPSQWFAADKRLLLWWVCGALWFVLVIPLGIAFLYTMTAGRCVVPMIEPPPPPPGHSSSHPCNFPTAHSLSMALVIGGWLYWALVYGYTWAVMQREAFAHGIQLLMTVVFGAGWLFVVTPGVAVALYLLMLGRCFWKTSPASSGPGYRLPVPGRRTTERIIFSPEAAQKHFGVRGTIILERDHEEN